MGAGTVKFRFVHHSDVMFLAHFTGGGIDSVLDLDVDEFFIYLDEAVKWYQKETAAPRRVIISGIEK